MTQTIAEVGLTSAQVCHRAHVTYRQLQRWCDLGVMAPSVAFGRGSGTSWRFSELDVAVARVCGRLALLGATLSTLRRVVEEITFRGDVFDRFEWLAVPSSGLVVFGGRDMDPTGGFGDSAWIVRLR